MMDCIESTCLFSLRMSLLWAPVLKANGCYIGAYVTAVDTFREVLKDKHFPPGNSILFTSSPVGSVTISVVKDDIISECAINVSAVAGYAGRRVEAKAKLEANRKRHLECTDFNRIPTTGFPEHYFKFAAYNELESRADVKTAILTAVFSSFQQQWYNGLQQLIENPYIYRRKLL
ncbi:chalcone isomerase [Tanacetum coccineum]